MIRLVCFLACLAMTGCVGSGLRVPKSVSRLHSVDQEMRSTGSNELIVRESAIKVLLEGEDIGLEELLSLAEMGSPEVQAARNDVGAAAGRLWQEELYPNPILELEAEDIPFSDLGFTSSENKVAIVQPVIIGSRRTHAISAAAAKYDKRHLLAQHKLRHVQGEVRRNYVELLYLKQTIALHSDLHSIAKHTFEIAKARFEAKAAPESEMIRTQLDLRQLELGTRRLQRQLVSSSTQLQSLLGGSRVPVLHISGELRVEFPEMKVDSLRAAVREGHPAVLAARKDVEAADRRVDQTKAARIPDTEIRLAYGRNAATDEDIVDVGIGLPLPLFNRGQGSILESRHLAAKARRDTESLVNTLLAQLAATYAAYMTAQDEVTTLQGKIIPDAERAFSQAEIGYQAGKTTLMDLLDSQRTLVNVRLSALESLKDMNEARALLWKIVGAEIDK